MEYGWIEKVIVVDETTTNHTDVWHSFAVDELLSEQAARQQQVICHLWCHQSAIILGQRDARLPYIKEALDDLEKQNLKTCVRHSGGAAVPLDKGVLNISLIFPLGHISESSYNDGFEKMYELIQAVCSDMPFNIKKGEIKGAYCPGDYDLSVNGLKFCGIAQRRKVKAYIVQAFVNIDGDSVKRAQLIKQFYERAVKDAIDADFPPIEPQTLASLAQFASFKTMYSDTETNEQATEVQAFVDRLNSVIRSSSSTNKKEPVDLSLYLTEENIKTKASELERRYRLD